MKPILAAALILAAGGGGAAWYATRDGSTVHAPVPKNTLPVTIEGSGRRHVFTVERATTEAEQQQGLMYRTDLTSDGGMLFRPYPAGGGAPQVANFWMKNTPTALDIIFIRADGTIARIAENTVPFSETLVSSGEPVAAVLELVGGRTAALGIEEGDRVSWPK